MHRFVSTIFVAVVAAGLAACGSSGGGGGGGGVSQSQLETKLKSEPQLRSVLQQGGAKAKVVSQLVDCIAKALEKDADKADLKKYVQGKLNINDLGAKSKGATNDAQNVAKTCAKNAVKSDQTSAPG